MIYFKLWVLDFTKPIPCAHMLPVACGKRISNTRESLRNIVKSLSNIEISLSYKPIFLTWNPIFTNRLSAFFNGFPLSSTAFRFLQRLSAFFNGFQIFLNGFRHQHNKSKYSDDDYFDSYIIFPLAPQASWLPINNTYVITQHTPVVHLCSQQCTISTI